jgi:isocitrate dehydrogenase kinase/phosphatase
MRAMAVTAALGEASIARKGAILVKWGFEKYRSGFRRITRRSEIHFEAADWPAVQQDAVLRLTLYTQVVRRVVAALVQAFGETGRDDALWSAMKHEYSVLMAGRGDLELAETFFNSVTRKVFTTVGVDAEREYVHLAQGGAGAAVKPLLGVVPVRTYPGALSMGLSPFSQGSVGHQILDDYAFAVPWADHDGDAKLISLEIDKATSAAWAWSPTAFDYVELLEPVFYRNKGAYLAGRVVRGDRALPLIIALLNRDGRIWVDAVLLTEVEASVVFSFTRSYFHVDVEAPADMIRFLRGIMPRKAVSELYIGLGYNKHGKTELYRDLLRHLARSDDCFEAARGEKGMVMIVFAMASYDLVFKVIRDVFGPTKTMSKHDVRAKYQFVFEHDRAGRLVDAQEFEHLEFDAARFEPAVLAELCAEARETVRREGDRVIFRHLYTERRVTPLNLYIREASPDAVHDAILDFGRALGDLAATNIFPGDMLAKNFGVTRSGRVVFYDYDELCLLTDCEFRELPQAEEGDDDERGGEATFYVGPRDIFPQEFITFLGLPKPLRELFARVHGDILRPAWWNQLKERLLRGEILDIVPYRPARRLHGRLPSGAPARG